MIAQLLFIIFSLAIILFGIPIAFARIFKEDLRRYVWAIIFGILLGIVGRKWIRPLAYWYYSMVCPQFWHTKIGYGLLYGLTVGLFDELLRFIILRTIYRNKHKWIRGRRGCIAFGLGQGWSSGFLAWGLFLIQLIQAYINGELQNYGVTFGDLFWGLFEVVVSVFLYIGMTFIMKYGLKRHKRTIPVIIAVVYHSIAIMLLYYIQYLFNLPVMIAQIVYAIMSVAAYICGAYYLKKLRR